MLLAEALIHRKEMKTRVADLGSRLQAAAVVQEGDTPFEDPGELLQALDETLGEYQRLITRIHQTNLVARLPDGRSLTEAIVARDLLDERMALVRAVAAKASQRNDRYAHAELRYQATVDVAALRKEVDRYARQRRELDMAIQRTNWTFPLVALA